MLHPPTKRPAAVVGAGIIGLASALELQRRGYEVVLYDQHMTTVANVPDGPGISLAAGAQFLPYVHDEVDSRTERFIHGLAAESRLFYEQLAADPQETGVLKLVNVELANARQDWSPALAALMNITARPLPAPITVEANQQSPGVHDRYYEFTTFSLAAPELLHYLRRRFCRMGGRLVRRTFSAGQLRRQTIPTIVAAGVGAMLFVNDPALRLRKGISLTYRPTVPLPPVAISADDLLLLPRADGSFVVGALYMDKPDSHEPEQAEIKELLGRICGLTRQSVGCFRSLPASVFAGSYTVRAAQRVVHPKGPQIYRDKGNAFLVHNYAHGSVGWTTAFGAARIAADLL